MHENTSPDDPQGTGLEVGVRITTIPGGPPTLQMLACYWRDGERVTDHLPPPASVIRALLAGVSHVAGTQEAPMEPPTRVMRSTAEALRMLNGRGPTHG